MLYRVPAELHLFSDPADAQPWRLYTRDVSVRGLGLISPTGCRSVTVARSSSRRPRGR